MSGYDQFLCGTFWFFRALLLASIGFLVLFKLLTKSRNLQNDRQTGWSLLLISLLLIAWKTLGGLTVTGVAQGGYRELTGMAFMGAGFLIRQYNVCERLNWRIALTAFLFLIMASFLFPSSMAWNATFSQFISLPLPAVAAFLALTYAATYIDRKESLLKKRIGVYRRKHALHLRVPPCGIQGRQCAQGSMVRPALASRRRTPYGN